MQMKPYVVRQGDYLAKIAHRFGFSENDVWTHPANAELADRRDPNLLCPGDILFVPEAPTASIALSTGQRNVFMGRVPRVEVKLLLERDGQPLCNEPYAVEGLDVPCEGNSDGKGRIVLDLPVTVSSVRLLLPKRGTSSMLLVGHLDPIETDSGLEGRLNNLGYHGNLESGVSNALQSFQEDNGLDPSGLPDQKTRDALLAAHRC